MEDNVKISSILSADSNCVHIYTSSIHKPQTVPLSCLYIHYQNFMRSSWECKHCLYKHIYIHACRQRIDVCVYIILHLCIDWFLRAASISCIQGTYPSFRTHRRHITEAKSWDNNILYHNYIDLIITHHKEADRRF